MGIDITEYLPDRYQTPDGGPADAEPAETSSGSEAQSEEPLDIDEELRELLPDGAWDKRPRHAGESVRTTFQISPTAIQLFERLSGRTGKPQKDLLGDALRLSRKALENSPERVRAAATQYEDEVDQIKKAMAIAPETRDGLNQLAEETGLPRDHLVEIGIRLAKVTLEKSIRKKLSPHEDILEDLKALCAAVEEVQTALGGARMENSSEEYADPVKQALLDILGTVRSMAEAVEEATRSWTPIEEDRQFL